MGIRVLRGTALAFLIFSFSALGGGRPDGIFCVGQRKFQGESTSFDFKAKTFTLPNPVWLAATSYDVYSDEKSILREFTNWGLSNDAEPLQHNHLTFINRDAEVTFELFGNKFMIPYADNQAIWAESKDGIILAFRGTTAGVTADSVTNLGWIGSIKRHFPPGVYSL